MSETIQYPLKRDHDRVEKILAILGVELPVHKIKIEWNVGSVLDVELHYKPVSKDRIDDAAIES